MAVGAMERFVPVEERLHEVVSRRNVLQAARGPSHHRVVDGDIGAGRDAVDIDTEDRFGAVGAVLIRLRPRFGLPIIGNEQENAAVERLSAASDGKRDGEAQRTGALRAWRKQGAARHRE